MMLKVEDLPRGWFTPADINFYRHIYDDLVPIRGRTAEIGSYRGRSICSVADIIKEKEIEAVCVDSYQPWEFAQPDDYYVFMESIERFGIEYQARLYEMPSLMAARLRDDGEFDFVFIDADHKYLSVKADIAAWEPKIKPGGYIGGHDFHDYPDVTKAVLERYGRRTMLRLDSSIWLVKL